MNWRENSVNTKIPTMNTEYLTILTFVSCKSIETIEML